ncbi:hypothetical protein ACIOD2_32240 [Amycolatopsis sp. NPDC088138]|uniref:hypothetical protein n=1 Tax=Amycolatopsis sp. NPDC088138 TaxID=3363938 RepID=UPI00381FC431
MTEDNRIPEIRAVLDELPGIEPHEQDATWRIADSRSKALQRIRAILDSAPPAPRVFFPGDTVPAGVEGRARDGDIYRWRDDRVLPPYFSPLVEVPQMTDQEWQHAVDSSGRTESA